MLSLAYLTPVTFPTLSITAGSDRLLCSADVLVLSSESLSLLSTEELSLNGDDEERSFDVGTSDRWTKSKTAFNDFSSSSSSTHSSCSSTNAPVVMT